MKTDAQLKKDVSAELEWEPSIDSAHVDTFAEKHAIERAVGRVQGVKAVRPIRGQ